MRAHPRTALAAFVALALSAFLTFTADAQVLTSARITGTVRDESGGALPGVTVTLTSPALQVPQVVKVSDAKGEYQFLDLSIGTYRVAYELPGFGTLVRDGIILSSGFAARVDAAMKVAAVSETVVVSGESPLVDVANTRGGATVTKDTIKVLPTSQNLQDILILSGGMEANPARAPLTGDTSQRTTGAGMAERTYGLVYRAGAAVEGIRSLANEVTDFGNVGEVDVKAFGNTAEEQSPNGDVRITLKSGGNDFHGLYSETYQHKRFESSNIDAALRAQGITEGNAVNYFSDTSGDLGGRVIRDKLWFYGSGRWRTSERLAPGFSSARGADGMFGTADDVVGTLPGSISNVQVKLSYQATARHKFIFFGGRNKLVDNNTNPTRFFPLEATVDFLETETKGKGEWQGSLTDRLFANVLVGTSGFVAQRRLHAPSKFPARFNRNTGMNIDAPFVSNVGFRTPRFPQASGSLTYVPGSHNVTAGYRLEWDSFTLDFPSLGNGDYLLVYDAPVAGGAVRTFNGAPARPVEIDVVNRPVFGKSRQDVRSAYVSDAWRMNNRVTLNLGLRWEQFVNWVDPSSRPAGPFQTPGEFPRVNVGNWPNFAPRAGVAYDLFGDGQTVLKATYAWYNMEWDQDYSAGFGNLYQKNSISTTAYRWTDADGNNDYTPGEVNLDVNGLDFISVTGAANNVVNPDLKMAHTHEITGSIERDLGGGFALRGLYVYKKAVDQIELVNVARPYNVWNVPLSRQDPGPDGVVGTSDDGGLLTVYDYDPAYRGSAFVANMYQNSNRADSFNNYEVTLNRRARGRWLPFFVSFTATKNHRWMERIVSTPNEELFPLDETWIHHGRLGGGYELPWGVSASAVYNAYNGIPSRRTYLFRGLPQSSTLTLPMEDMGSQWSRSRHLLNVRAAKYFSVGSAKNIMLAVDLFNALNTNVSWGGGSDGSGVTYASGPTFGYVTSIVTPRDLRFNVSFEF